MNKKVKAQITVYAALSVFLVITLICTCIRSAAVSAGRVRSGNGISAFHGSCICRVFQ